MFIYEETNELDSYLDDLGYNDFEGVHNEDNEYSNVSIPKEFVEV